MALNSLFKIVFKTADNPPFVANDVIIIYWDEESTDFITKLNGTQIYTGPDLGQNKSRSRTDPIIYYTVAQEPYELPPYRFCDGPNLVWFAPSRTFPYSVKNIDFDNPSCFLTGVVCDTSFTGAPVITRPSTETSSDGEILASATSSNGSVKYSLEDIPYAEMTNSSGNFTGLLVGTYTVYAKDPYGCLDTLIVILIASIQYGAKIRIEYDKLNGDVGQVDIEERGYTGDVEEVKGGTNPFVVRLRGENSDLFTSILTTECTIQLISETNFQFLDLFTQDDRKYRVVAKTNGVEYWRGFINPGLYQEQYYTNTNYYVSAEATDQLVRLRDFDFLDDDGNKIKGVNSLIKIIALILSKTNLNLSIRSCVNIFEIDMDQTDSDDPLEQTHIDTNSFYNKDGKPYALLDVLDSIITSFGARLFQWSGYWYIVPIDFYTETIEYREFDVNGDYVSNGSFDPVFDIKVSTEINRACWANRTQNLEVRKAFGEYTVVHKLSREDQVIKNGGFDEFKADVTTKFPPSGTFPHWTLVLNGNAADYIFIYSTDDLGNPKVKPFVYRNNDGYAISVQSDSTNTEKKEDAYIVSEEADIVFTKSDAVKFNFEFNCSKTNAAFYENPLCVKFKWSLKLDIYYLQANGTWSTDADNEWIEVVVKEVNFNTWNNIEITALCPDVDGEVDSSYVVKIMHGQTPYGPTWYYSSNTELKAAPTVDLPAGYINFINSSGVRWYQLTSGTKATSGDNILRPDDYATSTNEVYWTLIHKNPVLGIGTIGRSGDTVDITNLNTAFVRTFDNVSFELLPQGEKSPDEYTYPSINDENIKDVGTSNVFTGDVPTITNSKNLYINWYRYSDGTPTIQWNREGVSESKPLLQLLADRIIEQHNLPKFKLSGTLKTDTFFGFRNSLYEQSSGKYFVPMSIIINDLRCEYDVELQEVGPLTSTGVEDIGEFSSLEFNNEFNI